MREGVLAMLTVLLLAGCAGPTGPEGGAPAASEGPTAPREPYDLVLVFKRGSPVPGGPCVRPTSCEVPFVYMDTQTTGAVVHELEGWRLDARAEWNGSEPLRVWFREAESGAVVAEAEGSAPLAIPLDETMLETEVEYLVEAAPPVGGAATALDVRAILHFTPMT